MPAGAGVSARIHHTSIAVLHGLTGHELSVGDAKLIDFVHLYVDKKKGNGRTNFSPSFACMQSLSHVETEPNEANNHLTNRCALALNSVSRKYSERMQQIYAFCRLPVEDVSAASQSTRPLRPPACIHARACGVVPCLLCRASCHLCMHAMCRAARKVRRTNKH